MPKNVPAGGLLTRTGNVFVGKCSRRRRLNERMSDLHYSSLYRPFQGTVSCNSVVNKAVNGRFGRQICGSNENIDRRHLD